MQLCTLRQHGSRDSSRDRADAGHLAPAERDPAL